MPWTGKQFKSRHAHGLSDAQASHAASMANAMLRSGTSEGEAIATAISRAKSAGASGRLFPKKGG